MKIKDIKVGAMDGTIEAEVIDMEEPREVLNKFGVRMKVAKANIRDDSGEINLTLWNDDTGKFKVGDKIKLENGWVTEFKGNLQVSAGKNGKLEKI
jgi:replication factor A1